jgi:acyl-coenzyme A synthetase/AMP-(fatty) acid ligase
MFAPLSQLLRHAAERPDVTALSSPTRTYSFVEILAAVDATAIRLRSEGVKPRDVVALDLPAADEWIVTLALFRLATRSLSLQGVGAPAGLPVDVLVSAPGRRAAAAALVLEVDSGWIGEAERRASGAPPLVDYPRPDSICRLMLTSGTTGTPRAAAYSVAALAHRTAGLDRYWSDGRAELNFMGLSTTGGFHTALASLQHGQGFRAVDAINEASLRFAATSGVQVLCGSPAQIAHAIGIIKERGIALPQLEEVRVAGAASSSALLNLIDDTLGVAVRGVYGSTEGGGVTTRMLHADDDPADVGTALPGFELQIVDESRTPVAAGVVGIVRYRSKGLVSGYLEGRTVVPFPGGWFEPGDLGALTPDGTLLLAGRVAEIINLAGLKVDPAPVDAAACAFPGVRDAAAFGLETTPGKAQLCLALVADPGVDLRALDEALRRDLGAGHPTAFWRVAEIPRNRMGKVERGALATAFERASGS